VLTPAEAAAGMAGVPPQDQAAAVGQVPAKAYRDAGGSAGSEGERGE